MFEGCSTFAYDTYSAVPNVSHDSFVIGAWGPCGDNSPLRRVNAPTPNRGERANACFVAVNFRGCLALLFMVAKRALGAGEEILADYGEEYWTRLEASALEHKRLEAARRDLRQTLPLPSRNAVHK